MPIQPAAGDVSDPIESSNAGLCEEASEEVTNNTANGVGGENLDLQMRWWIGQEIFGNCVCWATHAYVPSSG